MKSSLLVKAVVLGALLAPALSSASSQQNSIQMSLCGEVTSASGSHYDQRDQDGSKTDYSMQVDCDINGKVARSKDSVVTIEQIASGRKGWISRYAQDLTRYSQATEEEANPRFRKPYVCIDATVTDDPCLAESKNVQILKFENMTSADRKARLKRLQQKRMAERQGQ